MAPGVMNTPMALDPKQLDKDQVICQAIMELEGVLADECINTCTPSYVSADDPREERNVPCFLSVYRCEHCIYADKEGRTLLPPTDPVEQEVQEFDETKARFDEEGKPIFDVIKGGLDG